MKNKMIFALIKKEVAEIFKDKKLLFAIFVIPVLLYPFILLFGFMGFSAGNSISSGGSNNVLIQGEVPDLFYEVINEESYYNYNFTTDDTLDHYANKIVFNDDETVTITRTINDFSSMEEIEFTTIFEKLKLKEYEKHYQENNLEINFIETNELKFIEEGEVSKVFSKVIGMILPYMSMLLVVSVIISLTIDSVIGEKEKNTLETLLSLPIKTFDIIISKLIVISGFSLLSLTINFLVMGLIFLAIVLTIGVELIQNIFGTTNIISLLAMFFNLYFLLFLVCIFISSVVMCLVVYCKDNKQAYSYTSFLTILIMFPALIGTNDNIELNFMYSLIPIVNMSLLIKEILLNEFNLIYLIIVYASYIIYTLLTIKFLTYSFSNETVLFDNKNSLQILNRKFLKKGSLPKVGDGILLYFIVLAVLFFSQLILPILIKDFILSTLMIQILIFIVPLGYALYCKFDLKKLYSLNKFKIKYLIIGFFLVFIFASVNLLLQSKLVIIFSEQAKALEEFSKILSFEKSIFTAMVISLAPAIFEECLFRGFLFKAFKGFEKPFVAILVTSILFGIFHLNIFQFFTGILLGIPLAYITYKSKSIYPAMVLHLLNNLIIYLIS